MSASAEAVAMQKDGGSVAFRLLLGTYAFARVLQVYPGRTPMIVVVALHVVPPAVFALWHGTRLYGRRAILIFFAISLTVGNAFENLGIRTGFPYGHYYFTDLMGPKFAGIPVLLGLAYVGMAYLSWIVAGAILGGGVRVEGRRRITLPLLAALIIMVWDLCQDPVWSTILHAWVWADGGAYFGVPLTNFFGWYLTVYVIFQLFALYLSRHVNATPPSPGYLRQAVLFYAVSAAGNVFLILPNTRPSMISDSAGAQWRVRDITEACALVTVFTMGAFATLAWARLAEQRRVIRQPR
jgi:putative membrane protein